MIVTLSDSHDDTAIAIKGNQNGFPISSFMVIALYFTHFYQSLLQLWQVFWISSIL